MGKRGLERSHSRKSAHTDECLWHGLDGMSKVTRPPVSAPPIPHHVELVSALDDEDDPSIVTVFPRHCTDTTTWISIDIAFAIDLDDAA